MEDNDRRPSDKLVLRDLYEQYWRCRDFEIKNLWQRSIFLGAFLILCFTGYGAFFSKAFFDKDNQLIYFDEECWKCHIFAMLIALLGVVFSRLWISQQAARPLLLALQGMFVLPVQMNCSLP